MERPQAWRCKTPRLAQDPHSLPGRRIKHSPRGRIDEETLEIRAVEVTSSDVGDAPMLPELLAQIAADQEIAGVTADGPMTHPNATMPSLIAGPALSSRPARTPNRGSQKRRARLPATRHCERQNTSAAPFGDDGAATTAEAASRYEPGQKTVRGTVFPANGCIV